MASDNSGSFSSKVGIAVYPKETVNEKLDVIGAYRGEKTCKGVVVLSDGRVLCSVGGAEKRKEDSRHLTCVRQ